MRIDLGKFVVMVLLAGFATHAEGGSGLATSNEDETVETGSYITSSWQSGDENAYFSQQSGGPEQLIKHEHWHGPVKIVSKCWEHEDCVVTTTQQVCECGDVALNAVRISDHSKLIIE
ncbi:MAG: hypothetical protein HY606_05295 [Planctomycetes bacterium]|nr:hypothetical protein [Planctomycetota bacterium]